MSTCNNKLLTFKIPGGVITALRDTTVQESHSKLYGLLLQLDYVIVTHGLLTATVNDVQVINGTKWNNGLDESE